MLKKTMFALTLACPIFAFADCPGHFDPHSQEAYHYDHVLKAECKTIAGSRNCVIREEDGRVFTDPNWKIAHTAIFKTGFKDGIYAVYPRSVTVRKYGEESSTSEASCRYDIVDKNLPAIAEVVIHSTPNAHWASDGSAVWKKQDSKTDYCIFPAYANDTNDCPMVMF